MVKIFRILLLLCCLSLPALAPSADGQTQEKPPLLPQEFGESVVNKTKAELGKNLFGAISERKTIGAISFCNENAIKITDLKSKEMKAVVKRISDKPRNPNNQANLKELSYIEYFKKQLLKGSIKPELVETETEFHYYSPIVTNKMCLQCHGSLGKDIQSSTYSKIKQLYPNDKAIGYKENQIRGVFSISWKKKKK